MPKRILFIVPCGSFWPSGVRRVLDYLPLLRRDGFSCSVMSYRSERVDRLLSLRAASGPLSGVTRAALSHPLFERASSARVLFTAAARLAVHDLVFAQSIPPPPWWIRFARRSRAKFVYDFDDAVFLRNPARVGYAVAHADAVVAGSHFNLDYARRLNPRSVLVPTPVPFDEFQEASPAPGGCDGCVNIGWMGGVTTVKYLELLRGPLTALAARFPGRIRFTAVGCGNRGDEVPRAEGVDTVVIPWIEPRSVPGMTKSFDIGVMPLFDGDWERGKCSLKLLEYMAAGIPAVGSAVGENPHVIRNGENGWLADSAEEWVDRLGRCVEDPQLRQAIGERGRETVRQRYSTDVCYRILRDDALAPALQGRWAVSPAEC